MMGADQYPNNEVTYVSIEKQLNGYEMKVLMKVYISNSTKCVSLRFSLKLSNFFFYRKRKVSLSEVMFSHKILFKLSIRRYIKKIIKLWLNCSICH